MGVTAVARCALGALALGVALSSCGGATETTSTSAESGANASTFGAAPEVVDGALDPRVDKAVDTLIDSAAAGSLAGAWT